MSKGKYPAWAKEYDFFVDHFYNGLNVLRLETPRSDMVTVIQEHYKQARVMRQGLLNTGDYSYLLLLPKEVLWNAFEEFCNTLDHDYYLKEDHHTRTIWEWEKRVGR